MKQSRYQEVKKLSGKGGKVVRVISQVTTFNIGAMLAAKHQERNGGR